MAGVHVQERAAKGAGQDLVRHPSACLTPAPPPVPARLTCRGRGASGIEGDYFSAEKDDDRATRMYEKLLNKRLRCGHSSGQQDAPRQVEKAPRRWF